ncbi:unnamed protein product [Effrenium voratum]|nr:unnamed protein product [Effrenium voratum]
MQSSSYCYGIDCAGTESNLANWYSLGEVQVVNSHEERNEVVRKMFSMEEIRLRRKREKTKQDCSKEWLFASRPDATFGWVIHDEKVEFRCLKDFTNLKGVMELKCDEGKWKVARHSADNPLEKKMLPADMNLWEEEYPECSWVYANNCTEEGAKDVIAGGRDDFSAPMVNMHSSDGQVHYRCKQLGDKPMRLVVRGHRRLLKAGDEVVVKGTDVAVVAGYNDETNQYTVGLVRQRRQAFKVHVADVEWLLRETSFTRRCEQGRYVPANIQVRCLMVMPEEEDELSPSDDASAKGDYAHKASLPRSSLLQEGAQEGANAAQAAQAAQAAHAEVQAKDLQDSFEPMALQPWPLVLSTDVDGVFRVDSCWTSPLNCSTGMPAEDTARSLQKESVVLGAPESEEPGWSWNATVAGCGALAVIVVVMLMGWSSLQDDKTK